ncbi:hypothetical protein ZYGR_0AL00340 [Zygosaccharomyces rouxii]|uniref:Uncharacterized protein n=1 Tax=Zygosaccharomyces rouxii TaxID=4956 RepID=A0A1Q3AF41_ZYGRO|nr:hypothetical protein ZYGR_0AL00340 [Zygosaccharomyces rouxii]
MIYVSSSLLGSSSDPLQKVSTVQRIEKKLDNILFVERCSRPFSMLRFTYALRNVVRIQTRFYRRRRLPTGTHIPALQQNKLLQDAGEIRLKSNDSNETEENLRKMGFEEWNSNNYIEELILRYLKHTNSGFRQSAKNLSNLDRKLKTDTLGENERLQLLFDYLLKECEIEIRTLNQSGTDTLEKSKELGDKSSDLPIESPEQLEDAVFSDLFESGKKDGRTHLNHVDLVYQILADLNDGKPQGLNVLTLEQLVQAFELSKLIGIEERRKRGIFLAGNLLYSLGTVRMDPVNESFYIDSLVNYGLYKKAFELFESNRVKVDERWWYELGMMVALRANYLNKFDKLFVATDLRFGKYPYVSPQVLRLAVRRKLLIGDIKSANKLTDRFLEMVSIYGCKRFDEAPYNEDSQMINFATEDQADDFLNEMTPPSDYDFITLIEYHLFRKNIHTAMKLVAKYLETDGTTDRNYRFIIVQLKFNLLQSFEQLRHSLGPHLNPDTVQQKLDELQKSFEEVRKEHNLDISFSQELLFNNVASLASFPELTKVMEDFVMKRATADEHLSPSKKFHALLKIILATGKEKQAFFLLSKLEETFLKSKRSPELEGTQFYAEVQPHHYAVFVEYFTLSKDRFPKSMHSNLERSVDKLVERIETHGVPYNSVLLTKLLIFYRDFNNFNKCFEIINQVMKEKLVNQLVTGSDQTTFYNRRDVTRPLYMEMWRAYGKYYKIFNKELERVEKKSNYSGWKTQVAKIIKKTHVHPEFSVRALFTTMVHQDNVLPDAKMYYMILTTFMRSRDWATVPAVLCTMTELHGLPLENAFIIYVTKGLEKELLVVLSRKHQANGQSVEESNKQAMAKVKELKLRGLILTPRFERQYDVDDLIPQILMLLKFKNPEDIQFNDVYEAMKELNIKKDNLSESINPVNNEIF